MLEPINGGVDTGHPFGDIGEDYYKKFFGDLGYVWKGGQHEGFHAANCYIGVIDLKKVKI